MTVRFIPLEDLGLLAPMIEDLAREPQKRTRASAFQRLASVLRNLHAFDGPLSSVTFLGKVTSQDGTRGLLIVQEAKGAELRVSIPDQNVVGQGPAASTQAKD